MSERTRAHDRASDARSLDASDLLEVLPPQPARAPSTRRWGAAVVALGALVVGAAAAGGWARREATGALGPVEVSASLNAPPSLSASVQVYRTETGARLGQLRVEVPGRVAEAAQVELGTVRAVAASGPPLEVLEFSALGLAHRAEDSGQRVVELEVPLVPERFENDRRYVLEAELVVDGQVAGRTTTATFEVTAPPVRERWEGRPKTMAERWTFEGPELPRLLAPARLLLGVDGSGRLRWSHLLQAGASDRLALEAYLREAQARGAPMFTPSETFIGRPVGGLIDWSVGLVRVPIPLEDIPPPYPVVYYRPGVVARPPGPWRRFGGIAILPRRAPTPEEPKPVEEAPRSREELERIAAPGRLGSAAP